MKIALAGNPNCGKTTLFNLLTGSNQYVGNWPGVTVEKKEGLWKEDRDVIIQDLPGIYSLSPYSPEEVVTRQYLVTEQPDAVLNIVDGTNITRNLYLTTQLLELGIPVVVAVNMMDLVRKRGDEIDLDKLSRGLGCPCVEISALKGEGAREAVQTAAALAAHPAERKGISLFSGPVEAALAEIREEIRGSVPDRSLQWFAVKFFERDQRVRKETGLAAREADIRRCEGLLEDDAEAIIAAQRYDYLETLVGSAVKKKHHGLTLSDKIDRIVTSPVLALPIFALIMFAMYAVAMGSFSFSIGTMGTDWMNDVLFGQWIPALMEQGMEAMQVSPWLQDLILKGIVAGVGAVLGFLPQILVLSALLAILEDVGYMSRVAFIMDRILRKFGLSGKSIIPMLVATGCGVPGILASRTIEQDRDRRITVMTTGFIPCGAKMPIIGLFAGAVFGNSPLVAVSAFFIGVSAVVISGVILKKSKALAGQPAPFVMELPAYHLPLPGNVLRTTLERGWDYGKRAATVVLLSSMVLWFLQSYGIVNGVFRAVEDNNQSLLADLGKAAAWIFYPLGWEGEMAWKSAVATFTGLIAKEEVVMTFGTLYHFAGDLSESGSEIWALVAADFGPARAYSFLMFNLLCAPCFAAMGAIRREMGDWKWTAAAIGYMCAFAYALSLIAYRLGGLFTGEAEFGPFTVLALGVLAGLIYLVVRKNKYADTNVKIGV